MMIKHWGNPEAMEWLAAASAVLSVYLAYWFWKLGRVRGLEALLEGTELSEGFRRPLVTFFVTGAIAAGQMIAVRMLAKSTFDVDVQLVLALGGLVVGAGLASALYWWEGRGHSPSKSAPRPALHAMLAGRSARKQIARFVFTFAALLLMIVALMRPQGEGKQREVKRMGVDVVFAVDLSRSMLADDVKPSRLEAAKGEIDRILKRLKGDRVGLVVFTAVSFIQSPLTSDYGAIDVYLEQIQPGMMPMGGTAIGRAMIDGSQLLLADPADGSAPMADHSKLVVIFTDGEDHETDPVRTAIELKKRGVRVYTVGFGSVSGATIPEYDDQGLPTGIMIRKGSPVESRLDEATLEKVAAAADGKYFHYTGPRSVAKGLAEEIDQLEKAELESLMMDTFEDYFYLLLAPAVVLLFIAGLFGDRRGAILASAAAQGAGKKGRPRRGRKASRRVGSVALLLLLAVSAGCGDDALFVRQNPNVEEGNALLAEGDYEGALEAYTLAKESLPEEPMLDYNIGLAELGAGRPERAKDALVKALAVSPEQRPERFKVLFALANAFYLLGDSTEKSIDDRGLSVHYFRQALANYRTALELDPSSDDARYNLELTLLRLFPPCRNFEDPLEENDSPEQATALSDEELAAAQLVICGGDDDFVRIDAGAGYKVTVSAEFSRLAQRVEPLDDSARLDYAHLELAVVPALGEPLAEDLSPAPPSS
ncbi:MAG: hypothetical protein COW42_16775, partial [Deltaproteobacteria bacterium CG17_big_fil_post_rev_8_21_14_2_50_63_7]